MSEKKIVKKYKKDKLTIIWQPDKCIHSGECVRRLPKVYDPKAKPWLKPENATVEELKEQITHCPSGALSFEMEDAPKEDIGTEVRIVVKKNGPILVHGNVRLEHPEGKIERKEKITAFCRCGASGNKPFCDGSHNRVGFSG